LLEDVDMVRRFVLAQVHGLMSENSAPGARLNQYVLRLDTVSKRERQSGSWMVRLTHPSENPSLFEAMTNFVFVYLDPQRGIRAIKDVTVGTNILVEPEHVDSALDMREESIVSGREVVVDAFAEFLQNGRLEKGYVSDVLTNDGKWLLTSAFRMSLVKMERPLNRNDMDIVYDSIAHLVQDNRDCYEADYGDELTTAFKLFIDSYAGGGAFKAGGEDRLISQLEEYIDNEVKPMRNDHNQLMRDLGSITHLILWSELERLERLRDQR